MTSCLTPASLLSVYMQHCVMQNKHDTLSCIIEEMQYLALENVAGISSWDAEEYAFLILVSFKTV
jgi:hypothetical protein